MNLFIGVSFVFTNTVNAIMNSALSVNLLELGNVHENVPSTEYRISQIFEVLNIFRNTVHNIKRNLNLQKG